MGSPVSQGSGIGVGVTSVSYRPPGGLDLASHIFQAHAGSLL